jgi:hypothetical protein
MIHEHQGKMVVKTYTLDPVSQKPITDGLPYELVMANYSQDIWAFGAVLYELFTGVKFFLTDMNDNIVDNSSMAQLYHFSDSFKKDYLLSRIKSDLLAKNLISQMLTKDPQRRPHISQIIAHPFLSGRTATRMVGDDPEFDVFISYRVASDLNHAEILYERLQAEGFKVWWDKKCLAPGVNWEIGFCDGLVKSRVFLPIISRGAINHPTNTRQSFPSLEDSSKSDSVLLEYSLALELRERGLTEKIYPVLIGDTEVIQCDGNNVIKYGNYFTGGCHPRLHGDVIVTSVQNQLEEHLNRLCFGTPLLENLTVSKVLNEITKNKGPLVEGVQNEAFDAVVVDAKKMLSQLDPLRTRLISTPSFIQSPTTPRQFRRFSDSMMEHSISFREGQSHKQIKL